MTILSKMLVDSDLLVYRVGFTTQEEDQGIARWRLNDMIDRMKDTLQIKDDQHFITSTDKSNFRFKLFPDYKANRILEKPKHYDYLRDLLRWEYGAKEIFEQEADDEIGIISTGLGGSGIICTIDKDLNQIPGWHFDFVTGRKFNISSIEAIRCFYEQLLVGDRSDNVDGCRRIGKVKATRILEGCQNENEMLKAVVDCYVQAYPENEWAEKLWLAGNLLWIRKQPNQMWEIANIRVDSKKVLEHFYQTKTLDGLTNQDDTSTLSQNKSESTPPTSK